MQVTRERLVRWEDPLAAAGAIRTMSGLDALHALVEGRISKPPIAELMGFTLIEADAGRAVFEGQPGEEHYNPIGAVHGGYAMTLLDSALGCAIHSLLPAGVGYTSTDTQVRFIKGMSRATGTVRAEATAVHVGRSTAVAEGRLLDRDGRVLAIGTTTCAILRA